MEKITGYKIYNEKQKNLTKKNELPSFYPPFPDKKYDIIYADPPWDYGGKLQYDKSSKGVDSLDINKDIFISSASFKYPTLKLKQLKDMPVDKFSKDDCLLFMWVTSPHLEQGLELGKSWGFSYRTIAFIWDKMVHNPSQYTMSYCELCLVFKKGRIPKPRGTRNEKQLLSVPRMEHSKKPSEVRDAIGRMFPTQDKLELFARQSSSGWETWGLEVPEK